jgi:hypothetical protein
VRNLSRTRWRSFSPISLDFKNVPDFKESQAAVGAVEHVIDHTTDIGS